MQSAQPTEWLYMVGQGTDRNELLPAEPGMVQVDLDGSRINDVEQLMTVIAEALDFPTYFGRNWNALEDCLSDMDWLPADIYVIWWTEANNLLRHEPEAFVEFLSVIASAAEFWYSQGKLFHLYVCDEVVFKMTRMLHGATLLPC